MTESEAAAKVFQAGGIERDLAALKALKEGAPSLVRKLANVLGNSERVAKNGFNKFHNYAYATEADISASVRTEMAKQGLMMIPTVETIEWQVVETNGGKKEKLCTVNWLFTLLDADSDAKIEFRNVGQGQDSGDKAFYKAATGALKYALKMLFLIPTGDDPEEASPEHGTVVDTAAEAAKAKLAAERAAGIQKMVAAFAAIGVDAAALDKLAGGPVANISNEKWTELRKTYGDMSKAPDRQTISGEMSRQIDAHAERLKADADPDEIAREEVRRQAEASLAEFDALKKANEKAAQEGMKGTTPQTAEAMKRALEQSLFKGAVDKLNAAKTEEEAIQIGGTFAELRKNLTAGDVKALERKYADTILILKDKAKEKKRVKIQDAPEPF